MTAQDAAWKPEDRTARANPAARAIGCVALAALATMACEGSPQPDAAVAIDASADVGVEDGGLTLDGGASEDWRACDPIVIGACGLPFPSDVYTTADAESETGLRLALSGRAVPSRTRTLEPFLALDGFSPVSSPMTWLAGATAAGLVGQDEMERSLASDSKTIWIDLTSGERVAHFAEIDQAYEDDPERLLLLRPAVSLSAGHRYAVAIRGVVDEAGAVIAPSPVFRALRDGLESDLPAVLERRAGYDALFAALESEGVARSELQIAWDFTVGSQESHTGDLLAMRDLALAEVGEDGPAYTILDIEVRDPEEDPSIAFRVTGEMTVPSFLTRPDPGGNLARDASGRPEARGTRTARFWLLIPRSAETTPARPVQWGHGLLGSGEEIFDFEAIHQLANAYGYALFAVDWTGMAADDIGHLAGVATSGDMGRFATVTERLAQGMIEALLAVRLVRGALADDARIAIGGHSPIDRVADPVFVGQSQGGILGGTYMALTTDVPRGILLVPGQGYSFLLQRNRGGWEMFSPLFESHYGARDVQRCLALMQLLWDRAEPSGFTPHVITDRLAGSRAHDVLLMVARNDHQVSHLSGHQMARTLGVPLLGPPVRELFGLETVTGPHTGSAMIEVDFGAPDVPSVNRPATDGDDPHTMIADPPWVAATLEQFIREGVVAAACDGPCDPT